MDAAHKRLRVLHRNSRLTLQESGWNTGQNFERFSFETVWFIHRRELQQKVKTIEQDKVYLEYKVDTLKDELTNVKVNKDEQRIRALDLKFELGEVRVAFV